MTAFIYLASVLQRGVSKPPTENIPSPQKLLKFKNCWSVIQAAKWNSNVFKKYWNIAGTICLIVILRTWDMFFQTGLTELHIVLHKKHSILFLAQNYKAS